jgi:hypothetical protein
MAQPSQRTLWCIFSDNLQRPFSVDCTLNVDTIDKVKERIWLESQNKIGQTDYYNLDLYSPVNPLKGSLTKENLVPLDPHQLISSDFPQSKDPYIDIVIVWQEQQQSETAQGTILHHKLLYYGDN